MDRQKLGDCLDCRRRERQRRIDVVKRGIRFAGNVAQQVVGLWKQHEAGRFVASLGKAGHQLFDLMNLDLSVLLAQ